MGILLDMLYRAHSKNLRILRRFLYERAKEGTSKAESAALKVGKESEEKPSLSEPTSVLIERDRQIQESKSN